MKKFGLILTLTVLFLTAQPVFSWAESLKFGVTPWQKGQSQDEIIQHYRPMLEYLSRETGDEYIIVSARDYKQMIGFLADGKVDLASISPVPYVLAKDLNPDIQLLVTELSLSKGSGKLTDSYFGYFLTLKTRNDINSIADLEGRKFGFVKKESSSGFKYPNAGLKKQGIDYKKYFKKYYFLGSHPRVTDAIAAGSIDAGATWAFNLAKATEKHGNIFKIIYTTPPIPNLCIAAHPGLSPEKSRAIQAALVKIDPSLLDGIPASGYVVRSDSFYDVVRLVALED